MISFSFFEGQKYCYINPGPGTLILQTSTEVMKSQQGKKQSILCVSLNTSQHPDFIPPFVIISKKY